MRFLDISVAAIIGLVSASTMMVWSPTPYSSASHRYQMEIGLRDLLVKVASDEGITRLQYSSLGVVCSLLGPYSNTSVTVSATIGGGGCVAGPPPGSVNATLRIPLLTGPVTLQAWESEGP